MSLKRRWIDILYNVATGSRRTRHLFTPIGAGIFVLFVISFIFMSLRLDRFLGFTGSAPARLNIILSGPLFGAFVWLTGWSLYHFVKAKGTPVPFNPPLELVSAGPYARTRNPMLTGIFALLFGLGAYLWSFSLVFIFTPLFILVNVWEIKMIEEPELEKRLGRPYIEYRQTTPMFLPRFRPRRKKI